VDKKKEAKINEIKSSTTRTNLVALIIQKGKNTSRSMTHEMANSPNKMLALSSLPEYLKTLAASKNTSLASCTAQIIVPIRKKLDGKV
jgi:hypothetical protein